MSANLKPTGACPKCGNKVWDGPRYKAANPDISVLGSYIDWLAFTCTECRYVQHVMPLDRQSEIQEELLARAREK